MVSLPLLPRELHTTQRPSATAQWTTLGRALELSRPPHERIVTDEFAPAFLTVSSRAVLAPLSLTAPLVRRAERLRVAGLATSALCRHAFIDTHLLTALAACEQVIVLGAGYDSRAYRFATELDGRPVFEVDLPPLSRRKAALVAEHIGPSTVVSVEIDFRTQSLPERLDEHGFVRGRPTFVVWEGVSMYLTESAVRDTLASLHALCGKGSTVAMDFWQDVEGHAAVDELRRVAQRAFRLIGEPLTFTTPARSIDRLFAGSGFDLVDRAEARALAARHATAGRTCDAGMFLAAAVRR